MSEEIRGFDDATRWLLDPEEGPLDGFFDPPKGLEGCADCAHEFVAKNDCPKCQYELGFTEGSWK